MINANTETTTFSNTVNIKILEQCHGILKFIWLCLKSNIHKHLSKSLETLA